MGSNYSECIFQYTTFSNTHVDQKFLDRYLPPQENLARDVVRSLRVNFSQIGNYEAVNKAAKIEIELTGTHLYKAAFSNESFYRSKEEYSGLNQIKYIFLYSKWKFLDLLWGNGESISKIILSSIIFITLISIFIFNCNEYSFNDAFFSAFYQFWGITPTFDISKNFSLSLTIGRLIFFSLFISILVKRLAKR